MDILTSLNILFIIGTKLIAVKIIARMGGFIVKKNSKRILAIVFALALAVTSLVGTSAFARAKVDGKYTTLTNAPQLCAYLFKNYDQGKMGSLSITQGTLFYSNDNYNEDYLLGGQHMPYRQYTDRLSGSEDLDNPEVPVYLVCIAGTEIIGGRPNNFDACLTTGFNLPNQYEREIKRVIEENIPKGSNLMLTGHSLGGMVAQQVCSDKTLKKDYNILYTVTFGSPCVKGESGYEGTLYRLCDKNDYVTYLSGNFVENFTKNMMEGMGMAMTSTGTVTRDGGYSGTGVLNALAHPELNGPHSAHMSYINEQTWGDVDVCGIPNGTHQLKLDKSTCQRFTTDTNSNDTLGVFYNSGNKTSGVVWDIVDFAEKVVQHV